MPLSPEKKSEYNRNYRESHPDRIIVSRKKYKKLHPGMVYKTNKIFRETHPKKVAEYNRKYSQLHPEVGAECRKEWFRKHPDALKARNLVNYRRRIGKIFPPSMCSFCGKSGVQIEGHHYDYSRPLDLTWLCRKCHKKVHREAS